ncbi:GntR family transcriptional regulator [Amycolatopsis sp.]|uniref:GntR family transcriptional regulator n=1 Tax=Amycolatopsis sp. TaxID=37632 RepID=UPI002DFE64B5|nr:GntR family transcriptional regulator [Amycolatopsis sp.]
MSDVFVELRAAILRGEYAPRRRLIDLVEQYDTSRFTLRNVLTRLANEGLVELQPNRGARVREISVPEPIEITEVRRAAEGLVAARAAERITDDPGRWFPCRNIWRSSTRSVRDPDKAKQSCCQRASLLRPPRWRRLFAIRGGFACPPPLTTCRCWA